MKIKEIEIGKTYWTKVSGRRVQVRVTERVEPSRFSSARITHFKVVRADNGKELTSRAASALHANKYDSPNRRAITAATTLAEALANNPTAAANEASWANAMPKPDEINSEDEDEEEQMIPHTALADRVCGTA